MLYNTIKETDDVYHGRNVFAGGDCLSSHALLEFIKSPAGYHGRLTGLIPPRDSEAYRAGRAAHCRILEGAEEYRRRYTFGGPVNEKTGKYYGQQTKHYEEWKAAQEAEGREVLSDADDTLCEFMAGAVSMHPEATEHLQTGDAEAVARAKYCGISCQVKIDWLRQDAIVDLKTCRDIEWFTKDFYGYKYHNQLSFYQKVFENFADVRLPAYVIAVEKAAPYRAAFYRIDQGVLDAAQQENENAVQRLRECAMTGLWPTGYEGVRVMSVPDRQPPHRPVA